MSALKLACSCATRLPARPAQWMIRVLILILLVQSTVAPVLPAYARQDKGERRGGEVVVVPAGTELAIYTMDELYSSTVLKGDAVYFKVARDVVVNGYPVIVKGTIAEGVATTVKIGRSFGITGKLVVQLGSTTTVDGQTIRLRGAYAKRGRVNPGAIGLTLLLGIPGPVLYHGKNAHVPAGTELRVYTESEKSVRVESLKARP